MAALPHSPFEFADVQAKGPYKPWRHTHRFTEAGGVTPIADAVEYTLPFGPLGRLAHWLQVGRDLSKIFDYWEKTVRVLLG